jgi:hypothetical protein
LANDRGPNSLLHRVIRAGRPDHVARLLDSGFDPSTGEADGTSPANAALFAFADDHLDEATYEAILDLLRQHGARIPGDDD